MCIVLVRCEYRRKMKHAYKYTRTNPRNFLRCVCARMHRAHQGPREQRTRRTLSLSAARSTWEKHWLTCRRRLSLYSAGHSTPEYSCIFTSYTAITKLITLSHGVLTIVSRWEGVRAAPWLCITIHTALAASTGDFEPPVERYSLGYELWGHTRPPDAPVLAENPSIQRKNWSTMRGTTFATVSLAGGKWRPPAIRVTRARHRYSPSPTEHTRK